MKGIFLVIFMTVGIWDARADDFHDGEVSTRTRPVLSALETLQLRRREEDRQVLGQAGSPKIQFHQIASRLGNARVIRYADGDQHIWPKELLGSYNADPVGCTIDYWPGNRTGTAFPQGNLTVRQSITIQNNGVGGTTPNFATYLRLRFDGGYIDCSVHRQRAPYAFTLGEIRRAFGDTGVGTGSPLLRFQITD